MGVRIVSEEEIRPLECSCRVLIAHRMDFAEQMHEFIRTQISDENAYLWWILTMPDEPTEEDFRDFAEDDEEWIHLCELFNKICKHYGVEAEA